jgi:hypothetical protein
MSDLDDYEVGFGRPPKAGRFQKGKSGNPNGRKRKRLTDAQIVAKVRDELIPITLNGKQVKVTSLEAATRQVLHTTLRKGGPRELEHLMKLLGKHGADPEWLKAEEARVGSELVMQKINKIMISVTPSPRQSADLRRRDEAEASMVMKCACCGPALHTRWAEEDGHEDRYRRTSHLRKFVEPDRMDEIEPR